MFTPEFSSLERGEFVLVASHSLGTTEAIELSVEYNKARIAFGFLHVPPAMQKCRMIYDVRGQQLSSAVLNNVEAAFDGLCAVEFIR